MSNPLIRHALMIEGKALIPETLIATTHALEAAVPVEVAILGSSEGHIRPNIYESPLN